MGGSRSGVPADDKTRLRRELARLKRENRRLGKALAFQDGNISLLHQINANMRATLQLAETCFVILTGVTAEPGLGFNRALLFLREPETGTLRGVMAISPDSRREMKRFYEEVAEKKFDFGFYIEQFYHQNLQVKNRLNTLVTGLAFPCETANLLSAALGERRCRLVAKPGRRDFAGIEPLRRVLKGPFALAPVATKDEEIGVLVADNHFTGRKITDESLLSLQTLTEFAASMILAVRRYEEAERLSVIDELTRLFNFRYLEKRLTEEVARGERYQRGFSLVMLDIDNFKNFNDRNGHLTGNKALMDLAEVIRKAIRSVDVPTRYGGEEFVVILPETPKRGAVRAAEKLLERIRGREFLGEEHQPGGKLTASGGVATYPEDGEEGEKLLAHADRMLYLAKARGKNRIEA